MGLGLKASTWDSAAWTCSAGMSARKAVSSALAASMLWNENLPNSSCCLALGFTSVSKYVL